MSKRGEWLARLERSTEWPLTVLALLLIPVLLIPELVSLGSETEAIFDALDYLIWGLFAADLLAKVVLAPNRGRYLRTHWVDVALVALPMLRPLRLARSTRLLRTLRLGRTSLAVGRVAIGARRLLARHSLDYALLVALVIVMTGGALVTVVERSGTDATIRDLPDGLWWAVTTVTTVGYGDTYPKTAAGRGIGVALMLVGISLFSVVTANVAAFFVEQREDELLKEVQALRREVHQLTRPTA